MTIKNLSEKLALELVAEKKFHELIPGASPDDHFESTGIASKGNNFLVVFSDTPHFARIDKSLTTGHGSNCLFRNMGKTTGYQDVTYDGRGQRFLALTEATKQGDSSNLPRINQFNTDLGYIEGRFIDYDVKGNDRILRGIAAIWRADQLSILAICKDNNCRGGKEGQTPGGGQIHVFQPEAGMWGRKESIRLPKDLPFRDFVSLEVRGNRLVILSQASSAIWIGTLQDSGWGFIDDGIIYDLPLGKKDKVRYCSVEGIAWVDDNRVAVISDRQHSRRPNKSCAKRDQSIHVFELPAG